MKNRYIFFKRLFKEYVILFDNNKSLGIDNILKKYINNNDINYIIIDKDNNIEIIERKVNNYKYYLIRIYLKELVDKIR